MRRLTLRDIAFRPNFRGGQGSLNFGGLRFFGGRRFAVTVQARDIDDLNRRGGIWRGRSLFNRLFLIRGEGGCRQQIGRYSLGFLDLYGLHLKLPLSYFNH